jgi:hypothetical protein
MASLAEGEGMMQLLQDAEGRAAAIRSEIAQLRETTMQLVRSQQTPDGACSSSSTSSSTISSTSSTSTSTSSSSSRGFWQQLGPEQQQRQQ